MSMRFSMRFPDHGDGEFTVQSSGKKISLYRELDLHVERERGRYENDVGDYVYSGRVWFNVRSYDLDDNPVPLFEPGIVRFFVKQENADIVTMPLVAIPTGRNIFTRHKAVHFTNDVRKIMDAMAKAGVGMTRREIGTMFVAPQWLSDYSNAVCQARLWEMVPANDGADEPVYIPRETK